MAELRTAGDGQEGSLAREKTWQRYIKEIPPDGYFFLPSCVLGAMYPAAEAMIPRLFDLLDLDWECNLGPGAMCTCCTGMSYHGDICTIESTLLVVARLWSLAQQAGFDTIATACVTSFGIHCECVELYRNEPGLKKKIDRLLRQACNREFDIPRHIVHVSDIVYRHRVRLGRDFMSYALVDAKTGRPLRVVDQVGCHYSKLFPDERSLGGADYCQVLVGLIQDWGGEAIDYPERRHCCGMGFRHSIITPNRGYTAACVGKKMASMEPFAPDLILTNCPGCQVHMDKQQWALKELTQREYYVPVLTYTELAGLLLGWDPYDIVGIQFHTVPVEPLLDKIGIPHDRRESWLDRNGQPLPCPDEIVRATEEDSRGDGELP